MTRRELIMLILVGTIGVLLLSYFYVYAPLQARLTSLETQLAQLRQQRQQMDETSRQVGRLRQEFARLQAFIAEVEAKLPAEKEIPALLVQLERLARSLGIDLQSIRPGQIVNDQAAAPPAGGAKPPAAGASAPTYLRFPIQLSIEGTYDQLVRLATELTAFPRMIAIRNLSLNLRQLPRLVWGIDADTYVLPREAR